jgi:predicted methyltransferase
LADDFRPDVLAKMTLAPFSQTEVEAAGFVPDAESTMLANKNDPHAIKVFDPSIKGETDCFVYRFVKP